MREKQHQGMDLSSAEEMEKGKHKRRKVPAGHGWRYCGSAFS